MFKTKIQKEWKDKYYINIKQKTLSIPDEIDSRGKASRETKKEAHYI